MADPLLHIKDTYYFEVPKALWPSGRESRDEFPDHWVRNDPHFRIWEAEQIHQALTDAAGNQQTQVVGWPTLKEEYEHWTHEDHANFGKPFTAFLEAKYDTVPPVAMNAESPAGTWYDLVQGKTQEEADQFQAKLNDGIADREITVENYIKKTPEWDQPKLDAYNKQLSGKILIPQPFGKLNNLYEAQSGFAISKFMIIELIIAAVLLLLFTRLAKKIKDGALPGGTTMRLLETMLVFLRDEVARPAIGGKEADKFVPYIWAIFFFVLGCNLFGMLPWLGAPSGTFSVTSALAVTTFSIVLVAGSKKFGIVGFWKNQVPSIDLPFVLAIILIPMLWLIEVAGLFIKHLVLGIRLLANMVAGHLVLLSIMGLAVLAAGTSTFWVTAPVAIIASTLFSVLELFVAFLQAYIFAFLSALFIGAAVHHH